MKSEAAEQRQRDYARKYVVWFCEAGRAWRVPSLQERSRHSQEFITLPVKTPWRC